MPFATQESKLLHQKRLLQQKPFTAKSFCTKPFAFDTQKLITHQQTIASFCHRRLCTQKGLHQKPLPEHGRHLKDMMKTWFERDRQIPATWLRHDRKMRTWQGQPGHQDMNAMGTFLGEDLPHSTWLPYPWSMYPKLIAGELKQHMTQLTETRLGRTPWHAWTPPWTSEPLACRGKEPEAFQELFVPVMPQGQFYCCGIQRRSTRGWPAIQAGQLHYWHVETLKCSKIALLLKLCFKHMHHDFLDSVSTCHWTLKTVETSLYGRKIILKKHFL